MDNDTLTCYGPGSVDSLDRNFGIQAAGAVTCIVFKFIEFGDIVTKAFNKIRAKFPAACVSTSAFQILTLVNGIGILNLSSAHMVYSCV